MWTIHVGHHLMWLQYITVTKTTSFDFEIHLINLTLHPCLPSLTQRVLLLDGGGTGGNCAVTIGVGVGVGFVGVDSSTEVSLNERSQ